MRPHLVRSPDTRAAGTEGPQHRHFHADVRGCRRHHTTTSPGRIAGADAGGRINWPCRLCLRRFQGKGLRTATRGVAPGLLPLRRIAIDQQCALSRHDATVSPPICESLPFRQGLADRLTPRPCGRQSRLASAACRHDSVTSSSTIGRTTSTGLGTHAASIARRRACHRSVACQLRTIRAWTGPIAGGRSCGTAHFQATMRSTSARMRV